MPAILRLGRQSNNTLFGSDADDLFQTFDGADILYGNGGNDIFLAGGGADSVFGGAGNDSVEAGEGNDTVHADAGADSISAGAGDDTVYAGEGADLVQADAAGSAGADIVYAGGGNDTLLGGAGNDVLRGEGGDDLIIGGPDGGSLVFARAPSSLDQAIALAGGDTVTLDVRSVQDVRAVQNPAGALGLTLNGVAHDVLAGAIGITIAGAAWTSFCVQLPEPLYWGANTGFTRTGADEAFALSSHWQQGGVAPGLADISRDLGLERARVLLAQEVIVALGGDGAAITGFVKAGGQDQVAVSGSLAISHAQSTAAQLLLWDIAYDFDGRDLGSLGLATGALRATGDAVSGALRAAYDGLLAGLSLREPLGAVLDPAHPTGIAIGDNLFGNDGADVFRFGRGDGVDLIWDFQAGQDVLELSGIRQADIAAVTFVTTVANPGMEPGGHQKLALILDTGGDAVVFNDLGDRGSQAAAVRFEDGTLSVAQLWARAVAAQAAPAPSPPPDPAPGDDVTPVIRVTATWWGGFQAEIVVTARKALSHWDVQLGSEWAVQAVWNAERGGQQGDMLELDNASWNGVLGAGQTASIGFTANTGVAGDIGAARIMEGLWVV